jgi:hypothetical protein
MNKFTKTAVLAAMAVLVSQAAQAQNNSGYLNGDLVLGFTKTSGTGSGNDYIVDIGATLGENGTTGATPSTYGNQQVSLSSYINLTAFNSTYGSANGVNVGVIGGDLFGGDNSQGALWTTTMRTGANPLSLAGTETTPGAPVNAGFLLNAAGYPQVLGPASGAGFVSSGNANSWTANIAKAPGVAGTAINSFASVLPTSANPMSAIGASDTTVLDLWYESANAQGNPTAWQYVGELSLGLSGASAVFNFDPADEVVAVPEPTTFGLLAGVGLLALSIRRQISATA